MAKQDQSRGVELSRLEVPLQDELEAGTLYIISTPIGNLQDITIRALNCLARVDWLAAEDTRRSAILLKHFGLRARMLSYHEFNKEERTRQLVERLKQGQTVGLISDAGTPGISDPGYKLIRAAISENIPLQAIPGPTAFVPALILSGLPTHRFVFEGFPPAKKKRRAFFERLKLEERTIILYESPHRLLKTLQDIYDVWGNRRIAMARELTKKFEQIWRGTAAELLQELKENPARGEIVLVVEGIPAEGARPVTEAKEVT